MIYAKRFFDLQLAFARRVAALSGMALAHTVLDYTNFYVRFGLGREFDPDHPGWQKYVGGLRGDDNDGAWTYRFYLRSPHTTPPGLVRTFGCFAYARLSSDRLRLHFHNTDSDGQSPLGKERQAQRLAELAALFECVKRSERHDVGVVGASWLYNLDAYRRLFPGSYLATAHVVHGRFRHLPLWGQFVDRNGEVRAGMAAPFLDRLAGVSTVEHLDQCFPLAVLGLEAPVSEFFTHYRV